MTIFLGLQCYTFQVFIGPGPYVYIFWRVNDSYLPEVLELVQLAAAMAAT